MAIKISGTEVINDAYSIVNVPTMTMTGNYGPNVHSNITNKSSSGTVSIDLDESQTFITQTGNATFNLSDSTRGNFSEIILVTNGYTTAFNGTDFFWSGDVEPAWSDHEIWRITCAGLSSAGSCAASAVGYDLAGTFIPTSGTGVTATGRESASGDLIDGDIICYAVGSLPSSSMDANLKFSRNSGFVVEIDGEVQGCSGGAIEWHNGTAYNTLTTSLQTVYTNTTVTPSAIKLVANEILYFTDGQGSDLTVSGSSSSGAYTIGSWFSTTANGQWVNINFDASTGGIAQFNTVNFVYDIEVWGRGAGFDDTLLATYTIRGYVEAEVDPGSR